jgi:hypothetical protein
LSIDDGKYCDTVILSTLILQQRWATTVILKYKKVIGMLSVGPTPVKECIKASITVKTRCTDMLVQAF